METLEKLQNDMVETARRNEAIAFLLGFKEYLPSINTAKVHQERYQAPMRWFHIPGIGRYNSFELKFNSDWNWLVSAAIEMKKYKFTHSEQFDGRQRTILDLFYDKIKLMSILDLDMKILWLRISDYALEILKQKQLEKK